MKRYVYSLTGFFLAQLVCYASDLDYELYRRKHPCVPAIVYETCYKGDERHVPACTMMRAFFRGTNTKSNHSGLSAADQFANAFNLSPQTTVELRQNMLACISGSPMVNNIPTTKARETELQNNVLENTPHDIKKFCRKNNSFPGCTLLMRNIYALQHPSPYSYNYYTSDKQARLSALKAIAIHQLYYSGGVDPRSVYEMFTHFNAIACGTMQPDANFPCGKKRPPISNAFPAPLGLMCSMPLQENLKKECYQLELAYFLLQHPTAQQLYDKSAHDLWEHVIVRKGVVKNHLVSMGYGDIKDDFHRLKEVFIKNAQESSAAKVQCHTCNGKQTESAEGSYPK